MFSNLLNLAEPDADPEAVVRELYAELKVLARRRMALERPGNTIDTTGLVHEAWIRLEKSAPGAWVNKAHFFGAAAEAMRRILVEAARRRLASKRGSGEIPEPLDGLEVADTPGDLRVIAVQEVARKAEPEKLEFKLG